MTLTSFEDLADLDSETAIRTGQDTDAYTDWGPVGSMSDILRGARFL